MKRRAFTAGALAALAPAARAQSPGGRHPRITYLTLFSPQTDKHREFAQAMLNQVHRQFIDAVKAGRGKRLKDSPELFTGLFWTGQQAIELGLADQLGNLDYVAREVIKAEDVVDYTRRDNVAERLAKKFGASIGEGAVHALKSIPALR